MAKAKLKETTAPAPFRGFSPRLFEFFEGLAAHQTRDWFLAHRADYDENVKAPMTAIVESLALAFAAHDIPLTGSAERSLFRLNRDVRFSKDKSPYKTNASAVLSRDGTKQARGVFYISLGARHDGAARGGMMAAGFYGSEPAELAALRQAIAGAPARWLAIEAALADAGLAFDTSSGLSRLPKGFETHAASAVAPALKLKGFHVRRNVPEAALYGPGLIDEAVAFARQTLPLLNFGWNALA